MCEARLRRVTYAASRIPRAELNRGLPWDGPLTLDIIKVRAVAWQA